MSNESENKRIDFTQFEGMTRDEWLQNGWHIGPNLIAELERCYYLIAKMQESIVKTIGECWVCGDYIDSCDSNTCERQILEDIELGTASE